MRFQHQVVHDFEGATRNFEQLEPLVSDDPADVSRASALRNLGIARGSVSLTFDGTIGQHLAIAHGLKNTPAAAGVWAVDGSEFLTVQQAAVPDATNLYVSANAAVTRTVHWIAIG